MKKTVLFIALVFFNYILAAQNNQISEFNGTVKFTNYSNYETYAGDKTKLVDIEALGANSTTLNTLKEAGSISQDDLPPFLQAVLNTDQIFTLGNYFIKLDVINFNALVINNTLPNAYNDLVNNNLNNVNIMLMDSSENQAIDILQRIDDGSLTIADYNNTNAAARWQWFWRSCAQAKRIKQDFFQIWNTDETAKKCEYKNPKLHFYADLKIVYQKFIFYFSLQTKLKSTNKCEGAPDINPLVQYDATLKIESAASWQVVASSPSGCRFVYSFTEQNTTNDRELNWRPYESGRALHRYNFSSQFYIKHVYEPTSAFVTLPFLQIQN